MLVVQKYGGTSVGTPDRIHAAWPSGSGSRSTPPGTALWSWSRAMGQHHRRAPPASPTRSPPTRSRRELDMLLTAGERISMALLSMALHDRGVPAISFTGSQSGIITDTAHTEARIIDMRPIRIPSGAGAGEGWSSWPASRA